MSTRQTLLKTNVNVHRSFIANFEYFAWNTLGKNLGNSVKRWAPKKHSGEKTMTEKKNQIAQPLVERKYLVNIFPPEIIKLLISTLAASNRISSF